MLSAFKPQPIIELKPRDKSKIESVLTYGDRVLVGLNTGALRIYRVNESNHEPSKAQPAGNPKSDDSPQKPGQLSVDLLREEEKFSRRPIQLLAIVKEANILVSLSDGYVSIHDLQTYALSERLEKTRGATTFVVTSNVVKDQESEIPSLVSRLAVAVKRKILLWTWQDMELNAEVREISLPASVKSLTWSTGTRLVVGMDPGFSLVDIESQAITNINKPSALGEVSGQNGVRFAAVSSSGMGYMGMGGWVPKPMATRISDGQVLLAKDVNTLFIDAEGNALEKRQIPWAMAPETVGYSYPYFLSLQQPIKGSLDIRSPETSSLLQSISVPNASILHVPQPNISLAHAGKGFLVASDRAVWRMLAVGYDAQIDELVSYGKYDEAVSLLGMLEDTLLDDKEGKIREVQMQKAQSLFAQRKYRPALDLFADAKAPPERVIKLYPSSIAGDLTTIEDPETSEAEQGMEEFPPESDKYTEEPADATPQKSALGKLKPKRTDSDAVSIRSTASGSDSVSVRGKPAKSQGNALEGSDLKAAVMALCSFLAQSRVQVQRSINNDGTLKEAAVVEHNEDVSKVPFRTLISLPHAIDYTKVDWQDELHKVAGLVDTTLFRAYMLALPSLAGPLFRLDNFCDPKVVEEKLYESGRYNDLIDFLHGKRLHREALELLEKFGRNEAAEEVMPALRGPVRTVGYLQQLPPDLIDIILEFAKWPIQANPELGMEVFLADTENAEHLPRKRVVDFLETLDLQLAQHYLEHVINELGDTTPDFHQMLVDEYLTKLKDTSFSGKERDAMQAKLEDFLRKSATYNKSKTFRQLPSENPIFYECRAIVLSAMGNHKQALSIYVFQISDYAKAEAYCNKIYLAQSTAPPPTSTSNYERPSNPSDPEDAQQPNIYTILLGLYLRPPPPHHGNKNWPPALELLSKHGARLPAFSTLDLMPDSLAVGSLESYFHGRIRNANSVLNEERIVRGLEGVKRVGIERELLLGKDGAATATKQGGRSRKVLIKEDDHCRVCLKRFGNSAVRVYPDNSVVHYGCVGRGSLSGNAGGPGMGMGGRKGSSFDGLKAGNWR